MPLVTMSASSMAPNNYIVIKAYLMSCIIKQINIPAIDYYGTCNRSRRQNGDLACYIYWGYLMCFREIINEINED